MENRMDRDLGELVTRYKQRVPLTWWSLILISTIGLILTAWLLNYAIVSESYTHGSLPAAKMFQRGLWGIIVWVILILVGIVKVITHPKQKVDIHRYGVFFQGKQNGTFLWDDFTGIQVDSVNTWWLFFPVQRERVIFSFLDDQKVVLDHHLNQLEKARQQIEHIIYPIIQDKMRAGYIKGAFLQFGKVLMHQANGIKIDGKVIRWESIRTIDVDNGKLLIHYYLDGGKTGEIKSGANQIINLPVLVSFAKERLAQRGD